MEGYIVSREFPDPDRIKENALLVYWSHQNRWMTMRMPRLAGSKKKLAAYIRSKPLELFMRTTLGELNVEFPLVTSQWDMAAENAYIDNSNKKFKFRVLSKPNDPLNLNLAIIEPDKPAKFSPGDKVIFTQDWGRQQANDKDYTVTLIRKGTAARIAVVGDDNMSYSVETTVGKFSWVRENYLRFNKIYTFVRFFI